MFASFVRSSRYLVAGYPPPGRCQYGAVGGRRRTLNEPASRQGADDKQGSCGHGLILEEQEAEGEPQ